MAKPDSVVRVLPEWPTAHLDRVVPAASSARVSYCNRRRDTGDGTHSGLDGFSSWPLEDRVLLHRHDVASRRDRHRELRFSELPRPYTRNPVTR